jgi:TPR repeat protein
VRASADQGNGEAQYRLALTLANGIATTRDDAQAMMWYEKAAAAGVAAAQTNLGARYASGIGVTQDFARAVQWFRKAADRGNAGAQFNLGVMYANGSGTPVDLVEAYKWLTLAAAAARGDEQQRYAATRETLGRRMTPEEQSQAQRRAQEWRRETNR